VSELAERLRAQLGPRAVAELAWPGRREPLPLALPGSVEELAELVRWCARERVRAAPVGVGSKLGWTRHPVGEVLALSTQRLQRVVEYEPGEGVLTALCGTRLSSLRELTAQHGQLVTPDVPAAERATLGGVLASGQSGYDRLRFGPARHHVLGATLVLADGSSARSGGRLVKNVTGFDLQRLYCGSFGTLGVLVEATLRLAPLPRAHALVTRAAADAAELTAAVRAVERSPLRPVALVATSAPGATGATGSPWQLALSLAGGPEAVAFELGCARALWPAATFLEGAAAQATWSALREQAPECEPRPWLRITCGTRSFPRALAFDFEHAHWSARRVAQPSSGILDVQLVAREGARVDSASLAELVRARAADVARELGPGASFTLRNPTRRTAGLVEQAPAPGTGERRLMDALRRALDPQGVFHGGPFEPAEVA